MSRKTHRSERQLDPRRLEEVRKLACLACGSPPPNDAHHVRHMEPTGWGTKASDKWAVPLCRRCHTQNHTHGKEFLFWLEVGVDVEEWFEESNGR